jgi:hypothetical protein
MEFQRNGERESERRKAIARWRLTELLQEDFYADVLDRNGTAKKLEKLSARSPQKRSIRIGG